MTPSSDTFYRAFVSGRWINARYTAGEWFDSQGARIEPEGWKPLFVPPREMMEENKQ